MANIAMNLTKEKKDILHKFQHKCHPELAIQRLSLSDEDMENLNMWYIHILKLYLYETYGFKVVGL